MAPTKKIVYDAGTGHVTVHGIRHNTMQIIEQAIEGVAYDDEHGVFRFRDEAFNRDWLAHNKVQLVVRQ